MQKEGERATGARRRGKARNLGPIGLLDTDEWMPRCANNAGKNPTQDGYFFTLAKDGIPAREFSGLENAKRKTAIEEEMLIVLPFKTKNR